MKLTEKKKEKIKKIFEYFIFISASIVLLGLFISLFWVIPLTIKEDRIKRVIEDSSLFDDNYKIWKVDVYNDKALAYVCENCKWAWNKPTSEYVFYLEKENNKWVIENKVMIWSK